MFTTYIFLRMQGLTAADCLPNMDDILATALAPDMQLT